MMSENEQDQFDPLYLYTQGSTLLGVCQALLFKNHPLPIAQLECIRYFGVNINRRLTRPTYIKNKTRLINNLL